MRTLEDRESAGSFLSSQEPKAKTVWWVLLSAAVVWYGIFRLAQPLSHEPFTPGFNGNDFKHIYLGASMLVRGEDPYDAKALLALARGRGLGAINPYVYLPFTGLIMSPLTLLDPPGALRFWFVLNHLFLLASLVLAFWALGIRPTPMHLAMAATLAALCYPLHRTLTAGQLNCALLFLFALVLALERKRWSIAAGAVAAFAFLFKIFPGVLLIYFGWKAMDNYLASHGAGGRNKYGVPRFRFLRFLFSMVGFGLLFLGVSVAWVGWEQHLAFRPLLAQMGYGQSTWADLGQQFYRDPANQSLNSFFHHIVAPLQGSGITPWLQAGPAWADGLTRTSTALCWVLALIGLAFQHRRTKRLLSVRRIGAMQTNPLSQDGTECSPVPNAAAFCVFILLGLLTPSIYWDHYAVLLLLPLLAYYQWLDSRAKPGAYGLLVLIALPLGAFLEMRAFWTGSLLGGALVVVAILLWRYRAEGARAALWSIAAACILARFDFGAAPFRQGAGLIAMSIKLWPTLALLLLLAWDGRSMGRLARKGCKI